MGNGLEASWSVDGPTFRVYIDDWFGLVRILKYTHITLVGNVFQSTSESE
jgi:hypothetical protein